MELQIPFAGVLFETIYHFFKVTHKRLQTSGDEILRLLHVNLVIELAIEEHRLDIHLMDVPVP
jgi:hypothetical protein